MSTYKVERSFNKSVPSWQSILENYNWSLVNDKFTKHVSPGFFVSLDAHLMDEVKESLEKLNCKTAHLYINTCLGPTYGKHKDDIDVYFWQVQGIAEWIVGKDRIILSPGDLITVKKNVYHEVIPKTPRAGISMSEV
jgi:mannose-6-phosphate isomerase-like protein (cupin superfamily)